MALHNITEIISPWCLEGHGEQGKRWLIRLHPLPFLIGRYPKCNLCLALSEISRKHAMIFERDGKLWVREFGSTNGTFVNRTRISEEHLLKDGDILHFSSQEFRVVHKPAEDTPMEECADDDDESTIVKEKMVLSCTFQDSEPDFLDMLRQGLVVGHFQPIFTLKDQNLCAYELLGRGNHPKLPPSPLPLFNLARSLGKEIELSELFRNVGIKQAMSMGNPKILFNTLAEEMDMNHLERSLAHLRRMAPDMSLAMEVHEATATDPTIMRRLRTLLDEMDMQLVYDDFGSGQARLLEIIKVPPDILKFDICLIKGIHLLPRQELKAVQTLLNMAQDLGIQVLAEGIEIKEEMLACMELGFDLGQGYYLGKPAPKLLA